MKARARKRLVDEDESDPDLEVDQLLASGERAIRRQRVAKVRELNLREVEAKAEAATLKQEQEVQRLKGEVSGGGSSTANPAAMLMAMLTAQGMEPVKVNEYIKALDNEAILRLSMLGSQNMNSLLPISLMMMSGNKQGSSLQDVLAMTKTVIDMNKSASGTWEMNQGAMLNRLVTETLPNIQMKLAAASSKFYEVQIESMKKEMEGMRGLDPFETVKKVKEAADALGMGNISTSLEVRKLELEDAREVRRIQADRENTKEILGTVTGLIEGRAGEVLEKLGSAGADRIRSGKGTVAPGSPPRTEDSPLIMLQCEACGGTFRAPRDAKAVKCPHCETVLSITSKQPAQGQGNVSVSEGPRVPSFDRGGSGDFTPRWSESPSEE